MDRKPLPDPRYAVEAVREDGSGMVTDLRFRLAPDPDHGPRAGQERERVWHLWGRKGLERETALADQADPETLPVLLGSGLGVCLERLLDAGLPVAVVDAEAEAVALTGARRASESRDLLWLDGTDPEATHRALLDWRKDHGGLPLVPVKIPLYPRLRPGLYAVLAGRLKDPRTSFWERARYPRFAQAKPRILLLHSDYFLMDEIGSALARLAVEHVRIDVGDMGRGREGFVEELLARTVSFRPDFALTVNHLGLDREGRLAGLLDELGLPLASWFVDSPELILYRYPRQNTPGVAVFTWDRDAVEPLRAMGFATVFHLPLATDPARFHPGAGDPDPAWIAPVSFVGHSLVDRVEGFWSETGLSRETRAAFDPALAGFAVDPERSAAEFLRAKHPSLARILDSLDSLEAALNLEKYVTFAATRDHRAACLRALAGREPLVVGDAGWPALLGPDAGKGGWWKSHPPVQYGRDLPRLYPAAQVNFNATSLQMKGAVNQRVFDCPAAGAFVLTDHRRQLEELFEPGLEVAVYESVEGIPEVLDRWLADGPGREKLARRARARVLSEHTYDRRLERLMADMRRTFG